MNKIYKEFFIDKSEDEIVSSFLEDLVSTNRGHNFLVDWDKISNYMEKYKVELNILNSIIGSKNFEQELKEILRKYPEVLKVIPILVATRDRRFQLIQNFIDGENNIIEYNFKKRDLSDEEINKIINFVEKTGLKDFLKNNLRNNLYDYVTGVEVGMDTHARKNRSGKAMELALKPIIEEIISRLDINDRIDIIFQKKFKYLTKNYDIPISLEIKNRRADFILVKDNTRVINIEVNFYAGSGSKPQEIVDSYINRQNDLYNDSIDFIWITDGDGLREQINQTKKAFEKIDYFLNLDFVKEGLLEEIIKQIYNI